jgi:hypothetical protein
MGDDKLDGSLGSAGGERGCSIHARQHEPKHDDVDSEALASFGLGKRLRGFDTRRRRWCESGSGGGGRRSPGHTSYMPTSMVPQCRSGRRQDEEGVGERGDTKGE